MHQSRTHKPKNLLHCSGARMKDLNLNIVMSAKSYETSGQLYKSDNIIYTTTKKTHVQVLQARLTTECDKHFNQSLFTNLEPYCTYYACLYRGT